MTYLRRHADDRLRHLLSVHPACLIEGVRGVGKTTTAQQAASSVLRLDHLPTADQVANDPQAAFAALPAPVLIDEWQRVPEVWDAVRRMVDEDRTPGRFILSGSSRDAVTADVHAGAGRIMVMRMRPMTLCERRGVEPAVALQDLAEHGIEAVRGVRSPLDPARQQVPTVESGLPGYLGMALGDHQETLRAYLDLAVSRDLAAVSSVQRDAGKLRGYLRSYAAAVATTADHAGIHQAAGVSKATGESYHDLLSRVGLIEELHGWSHNRLKRLTKRPKRHLVDPALSAADHHDTQERLTVRQTRLGELFESVVVCQIIAAVEAQGLGWRFSHLRTAGGDQECDLIADLPDGTVLAFEAKLSQTAEGSDARHLAALRDRLGEAFKAGIVVHPGTAGYRLGDRLAVAPIGILV